MSRWSVSSLGWGGVVAGALVVTAAGLPLHAAAAAGTATPAVTPVASHAAAQADPELEFRTTTLDRYCVGCHSARTKSGGLVLEGVDYNAIAEAPQMWEKVVRKMRDGAMPPVNSPRPDKAGYDRFSAALEARLDAARPNPGRPTVHRLNRLEYTNAVRDLLALEVDGASLLPADESGYGFDNIADVLSVTPGLLERYMFAAQKVSTMAVGDPNAHSVISTYTVPAALAQDRRMSDSLPFRSRGGTVINHYFPADGEYVFKFKLRRAFSNAGTIGYNTKERIGVRLDGVQIKEFVVGGACEGAENMKKPECVILPGVQTSSEYSIHLDDALEVRVPAKAGRHELGVSFAENSAAMQEGVGGRFGMNQQAIDRVIVEGPIEAKGVSETPSRLKIFSCKPTKASDEAACAEKILGTLARRAYRRPVTPAEVQTLVGFYKTGRIEGSFDKGIQFAIERLLVSPNFLLRVERDPATALAGAPYRISNLELATRLSFFLWSSIPDDELITVASTGKLSDPKVLEAQVKRMLADERANQLVSNFAAQWLYLRDLKKLVPAPSVFPTFNDNLRQAFLRETEMFLASQMRDDRPVPELLTANYTFVNEQLAKFYGYPNVIGTHFRKVDVTDPNRHGILGHGSLLTVTSYATRTSVVQRGKYIMANIMGTPPPLPPPGVPPLSDTGKNGAPASVRERMVAHRANPVCAACHARMDPLGFALENFDAIGKYRTLDSGQPIDASGNFPDGTKFNGPAEFKAVLLSHSDQFARTFTEKLMIYAFGRGLEYYDQPSVRKIMKDSASSNYKWSTIIMGIVTSTPFQMRQARDAAELTTVAEQAK